MALPVPLPLFHWRRIRNLDKEKQTLAASLSERRRQREAEEDRENEAEKWTEERHEENEGQKERGRVGREPERIFKEWHLPVAIHRFSLYHPPTHTRTQHTRTHDPSGASRFIFAYSALDDAATAHGTIELLF